MADLKPCPFCGCHGVTMQSGAFDPYRHIIKCDDCPGMADFFSSTAEEAANAWNRRVVEQPQPSNGDREGGVV